VPKVFAARARDWENNDTASMELGILAPAYEHAAAAFLKLTGGLETDEARTRVPAARPGTVRLLLMQRND